MEYYKMDFTTKTLTITKAFADQAADDADSAENKVILRFMNDFPDLKIVRRTHRTPRKYITKSGEEYSRNQYKNLTYENMERFINALKDGESKEKVLEAYNFLRYSSGDIQTNTYKTVREWFVQQFPQYRKKPLFYLTNEVGVIDISRFIDKEKQTDAS